MTTKVFGPLAVVLVLVAGAAACGGEDDAAGSRAPGNPAVSGLVTPGVQADGSYQLGSLPDPDAAAALAIAVEVLPQAVAYDYRTLDDTLAQATGAMTTTFAEEFRRTFEASTRAKATRDQAITTALVRGAGVVDGVMQDRVTCLVYLDQVLVSSKQKKPNSPLKVVQNRVRVALQKVDGIWKVDGIEPF